MWSCLHHVISDITTDLQSRSSRCLADGRRADSTIPHFHNFEVMQYCSMQYEVWKQRASNAWWKRHAANLLKRPTDQLHTGSLATAYWHTQTTQHRGSVLRLLSHQSWHSTVNRSTPRLCTCLDVFFWPSAVLPSNASGLYCFTVHNRLHVNSLKLLSSRQDERRSRRSRGNKQNLHCMVKCQRLLGHGSISREFGGSRLQSQFWRGVFQLFP